ncbi:hypothetical protein BCR42DRAFT_416409 [Absidia repens]|uniref:Membrane anchor Opy2 N-terminal domain-containing protein n=1 Tax=Absidia repens TaxID=90262 RepID=A0A1X2IEG5_9FUNG|nr:hypothetical protein BCR42DRAFT_416409 [Absidia repens]
MPPSSLSLFVLLLLSLLSVSVFSQHTTSPRFTPQPTSSGIVCIQMVCPSPDSSQPTCPSDCSSGCKVIPDQCCPQLTVAVCQDNNGSTSTDSPSASATGGSPTATAQSSSPSSTVVSSSPSSTAAPSSSPSPNTNVGTVLQPSLACMLGFSIIILSLFSY